MDGWLSNIEFSIKAAGKDIAQLADVLGHSSINTTRIYIMTSGAEHRQNMEKLDLVMWEKRRQNKKVT